MTESEYQLEVNTKYQIVVDGLKSEARRKNGEQYDIWVKSLKQCNHCGSSQLVKKYRDVNGKTGGSFGGSLFSFGGYIDGEIQTDIVLLCKDCESEQKPYNATYYDEEDILESSLYRLYFYFKKLDKEVEFDPRNPDEKFGSLREKIDYHRRNTEVEYRDANESSWLKSLYPDTIRWLVKNYCGTGLYSEIQHWEDEKFYAWGCKRKPEIEVFGWWNNVKKLLTKKIKWPK